MYLLCRSWGNCNILLVFSGVQKVASIEYRWVEKLEKRGKPCIAFVFKCHLRTMVTLERVIFTFNNRPRYLRKYRAIRVTWCFGKQILLVGSWIDFLISCLEKRRGATHLGGVSILLSEDDI